MLKNIKFLDIEVDTQLYSFQLHLFDYYEPNSFNIRVSYVVGTRVTFFFSLLKWMLPGNESMFQTYCGKLAKGCCSRIILEYYDDLDGKSLEIAFRNTGIVYERFNNYTRAKPNERYFSLSDKNDSHLRMIESQLYVLDLSNELEIQYAIARTAEILENNKGHRLDDFWGFLYQLIRDTADYDILDIQGTTIKYADLIEMDILHEPDDLRYLYGMAYMMYSCYVNGGVLVLDNAHLLEPSTLLGIIRMYEEGISDRAKAQLIICSPDTDLYKTRYKSVVRPCLTTDPLTTFNSTNTELWMKYI
jgi:hypothetical protein